MKQSLVAFIFVLTFSTLFQHSSYGQCNGCNVMVCDGVNCDDGSPADGVQTSRNCGCGQEIQGACAIVEIDMTLNPYYDPNDPNCSLYFDTQEQGNFSIYFTDENCEVADCASPDFVVNSGGTITGFPTSGVFTLMVCKNGGNAGRRDFTFSSSCSTIENCVNLIDDNNNGFIDCDDLDCTQDVSCEYSETTSGNDGGLESNNRLSQKIAKRQFFRTKNNTSNDEIRSAENIFTEVQNRGQDWRGPEDLDIIIEEFIPDQAIPGTETYISSPNDLVNITNATEVFSVDIFETEKRVASIFATRSENGVYEHTKFICDRLNGAEIEQIWEYPFDGQNNLILTKFKRNNGITEYASNFSFFKLGTERFQLESHWNLSDYTDGHTYGNFQIWANNMENLQKLVQEVLLIIQSKGQIEVVNFSGAPELFVEKAAYQKGVVTLDIINKTGANQINIHGALNTTETSDSENYTKTVLLSGTEREQVYLETEGLYNIGLTLNHEYEMVADGVFIADGAWGIDYSISEAMIYDFDIEQGSFDPMEEGFAVERDVKLQGTMKNDVSIYRSFNPAFRPIDLSDQDLLVFNARGAGDMQVTIIRESILEWEQQMNTTVKLKEASEKYTLPLKRFYSPGYDPDWSDVKMIVFTLKNQGGESQYFDVSLENVSFQQAGHDWGYLDDGFESTVIPNPLTDKGTVLFRSPEAAEYTFQLLSASGIVLRETRSYSQPGINEIAIENQEFIPGLYFYNILLSSGELYSGKILIQEKR
ncbi:MAG: hypothetical protein DWQ02_16705 [Bacteroidetes bacterium]|nr:MAG: hypothetical protein DWQ02_16705 [Bacteroidota bacterium]